MDTTMPEQLNLFPEYNSIPTVPVRSLSYYNSTELKIHLLHTGWTELEVDTLINPKIPNGTMTTYSFDSNSEDPLDQKLMAGGYPSHFNIWIF
jgi:hypothetical protein